MKRFREVFTEDQSRVLAAEFNRLWLRFVVMTVILATFTAGGYAVGLYVNSKDSARAQKLALDNCHRSQDGRRALRLALETVYPPNDLQHPTEKQKAAIDGRDLQQRAEATEFWIAENESGALRIPKC